MTTRRTVPNALLDMDGNAADTPLQAGAFAAGLAPNGVGTLLDMGGNGADKPLLAGAFAAGLAPNGVGCACACALLTKIKQKYSCYVCMYCTSSHQ